MDQEFQLGTLVAMCVCAGAQGLTGIALTKSLLESGQKVVAVALVPCKLVPGRTVRPTPSERLCWFLSCLLGRARVRAACAGMAINYPAHVNMCMQSGALQ
eukprot:1157486-Pelagomonas_calceolata.AAC.6